MKLIIIWFTVSLLLFHVTPVKAVSTEPVGLILTWQQDPATTMTIDWHTEPGSGGSSTIHFRQEGHTQWNEMNAEQSEFPFSNRIIHRVEITDLQPDRQYQFRVGEFERIYTFNTMPSDLYRPLRFAVGGNVMYDKEWMAQMNHQVMQTNPDFILWGGDLAYDMASEDRVENWYDFFEIMMESLISEEGKVIPIIVSIGDHEMEKQFTYNYDDYEPTDQWRSTHAPYFYSLFAFPGQPGYNVLDFGNYMSILALDSYHTNYPGGEQEAWLRAQLAQRQDVPHVFPLYHVGGWSSVKGVEFGPEQKAVYDYFYPAFEDGNVRVAFENHDYAYKRTPPMQGAEAVSRGNGVVYLGDGAWGSPTLNHVRHLNESRMRPQSERYGHFEIRADGIFDDISSIWYLDEFASERHFILATVYDDNQHFMVIDQDGNTIDEYTEDNFDPYVPQEPQTGRWVTNMTVTEGGLGWFIQPNINIGSQVYVDRETVIDEIPETYQGLEWIQTEFRAAGRNTELASFEVPSSGRIYIGLDENVSEIPSWLSDWDLTTDMITLADEDQQIALNIYSREVTAGENVILGPQLDRESYMYIVLTHYNNASISNLVVNDGNHWIKAPYFGVHRLLFTDESFAASEIPDALKGLEWIQTSNSSRSSNEDPIASFQMEQDGYIYLGINSLHSNSPPEWLLDWQRIPDNDIRAGFSFHMYEKAYRAGQTVNLSPIASPRGSMYFVLIDNTRQVTDIDRIADEQPKDFILYANYPNPFNPSTSIEFAVPQASHVTIEVYNITGQLITTLVNETREVGYHQVEFDGSHLASGVYIYRMQAAGFVESRKFMLIK